MSTALAPAIQWVAAEPLWGPAADAVESTDDILAMRRPVLLRFGSDTFMDDLAAVLNDPDGDLSAHEARPVSFRPPLPDPDDGWDPTPDRLKLYLPLHGDFNLVAASLVCRATGLPDHQMSPADQEEVGFVLRRVERSTNGDGVETEYAWATDPSQTGGGGAAAQTWLPITLGAESAIGPGEQVFPMFPVPFPHGPQQRRLFVGLIPASSGATFRSGGRLEPIPPPAEGASTTGRAERDPRWDEFDRLVVDPLVAIRDRDRLKDPDTQDQMDALAAQMVEASSFVLLDFADFLSRYLPDLWERLVEHRRPTDADLPAQALYDALAWGVPSGGYRWREPLIEAWNQRMAITGENGEPTLAENLREVGEAELTVRLENVDPDGDDPGTASLQGLVRDALPALGTPEATGSVAGEATGSDTGSGTTTGATPSGTPPDQPMPKFDPSGAAVYRIRCLYRRPRCAPFPTDITSQPSKDFAIASMFDPDAPARDIRIPMPIDTSIKDLRKFRKNIGFLISNQLRGQMNRVTDLKKALDGDLGQAESWDLGMICQFSIPIITICALIVLMIFLYLLNIVFFWLPFFRICLPIPVKSKS